MKKFSMALLLVFLAVFPLAASAQQTATQTLTITINAALTITTTTLPAGVVSAPYSASITVTGGSGALSYRIAPNGSLPPGLTLSATTGGISGTPTASGSFPFTVSVSDSGVVTQTATKALTIIVVPLLAISTTTLPNGTIGLPYSQTVAIGGGTAPYTCAISSGTLPAGLTLSQPTATDSTHCTIAGTPTSAGSSTVILKVADSTAL